MTQVIVLNGGSSSGKSRLARELQGVLPGAWLSLSVDDLVDAMPPALVSGGDGIGFGDAGEVSVGEQFRTLETAWLAGIAAMARAGARVVLDDVFLGGAESQSRVRQQLEGLDVLWVGVRCAPEVAAEREKARGDRTTGMAELQAEVVHEGVHYDLEVDTRVSASLECARAVAARVDS
ncbi:chloramphenicol phosphotransferase CPT [Kribbella sp. NPDC051770]|uniref:chloramphenicol phosphotransferase CPT n=1 Tax=Kribbella sp. NPDC051770 TaxID=3155413 RepID=UPI003441AD11